MPRCAQRYGNDPGKRQTEVVGIFPNDAAITRLVGAILLEQSDEGAVQRARDITLESIAPMSDGESRQLHHDRGTTP